MCTDHAHDRYMHMQFPCACTHQRWMRTPLGPHLFSSQSFSPRPLDPMGPLWAPLASWAQGLCGQKEQSLRDWPLLFLRMTPKGSCLKVPGGSIWTPLGSIYFLSFFFGAKLFFLSFRRSPKGSVLTESKELRSCVRVL